eukprot:TRINITY_DN94365_c0_g1_i1.p1 TRINITY_DN94365_c0_g1~~TRINITY_DN94365_c0_g1_i1.p1  ORF type:complete len:443 (-),score=88.35 TRINITY_DN94365_c0_g1_i1:40-1254(-)
MAGAIGNWNEENPVKRIESGDRIVAVNGVGGDAQAMVKEVKERSLLQLLVRKGEVKAAPEPPAVEGMQRAGVLNPLLPPRTVDVLLDIRARAAEKQLGNNHVPTASTTGKGTEVDRSSEAPNHYQVLSLPMKADETEVKKSYRKLVLQWHPDKHPTDREEAETKIRLINAAYEILSNPLKRQGYDQMLQALERKRLGVRLETQFIKPRMSIPKEFMLCPLGHSDKFVRVVQNKLVVQSREDAVGVGFQDFFQAAKFSLWWLPEVNNMCRLRARESAASGVDGGMNVTFNFEVGQEEDDTVETGVQLAPSQDMRKCNLIVTASPFSQGAFRFEGAFWPGRYLSYRSSAGSARSSGGLLMAGKEKVEFGNDVADFVLVDFSAAYKYMTMTEARSCTLLQLFCKCID